MNALGPLSTEAPAIAVYVDCRGSGTVDVQVLDLGGFTAPCQADPEGEGLRNVFDTRSTEGEFSVQVEGETGQQWAISITETTQDTPGCSHRHLRTAHAWDRCIQAARAVIGRGATCAAV